ncbi:MAG: hypothetical protein COC01_03740 [Bacteroidetes bacterium]|nr:MAG: hypothetical protein COC01_03740 [Bacteroidota bacterium]
MIHKMKKLIFIIPLLLSGVTDLNAGCTSEEVEVYIIITTDTYGYETYWEIVPFSNSCGSNTVASGGNFNVGCNGGGAQEQDKSGYANNTTITEGPFCLTDGNDYKLIAVDDWGEGGASYVINIESYPVYEFDNTSALESFVINAVAPPAIDGALESISTPANLLIGSIKITGEIKNIGTTTITSADLNYSVDNGTTKTITKEGLSIEPFTTYDFTHSTPWEPTVAGAYSVKIWISNINGKGQDADEENDVITMEIIIKEPIPDITQSYIVDSVTLSYETIGTSSDNVNTPRDLDFHPDGDLWVINKGTENSGGSTVSFKNPGESNQTSDYRQDGNAWHFMSLPSGIAFSDNGNFATSTSVYDANHGTGSPFTGPALWSSDPAIYAQPSGGNGSHLDMLHVSPYCMGIAHEQDNVFWVFDGHSNDVVRYDFGEDHGPGNSDHDDGKIRRYPEISVDRIDDHISSHLVLDKVNKWLYVIDNGNNRVLGLDINSGTVGGTPSFGPFETLAEYTNVTGVDWKVIVDNGLVEPSGIDVIGSRLIVSDHSNGDIIIYNKSTSPATELGRIKTGDPGIMGVVIGPDGRIWYANATDSKIIKIEVSKEVANTINEVPNKEQFKLYPNPSTGVIHLSALSKNNSLNKITVLDALGRSVYSSKITTGQEYTFDLTHLPTGYYYLKLDNGHTISTRKFIKVD